MNDDDDDDDFIFYFFDKVQQKKKFNFSTNIKPPPLLMNWTAHEDEMITSITCVEQDEIFLFTSSTDNCVVLWTFNGEKIATCGIGEVGNG